MVLWWLKVADNPPWFHYPALIGQIGSFTLSVLLLFIYYRCLHPNLLLPSVAICTRNAVCLSDVAKDGVPSPRSIPARLGRLDTVGSIEQMVEAIEASHTNGVKA